MSTGKTFSSPTSVWKGCSFLSLDPGINNTGFAFYRINDDHSLKLREYGVISPPDNDEPLIRVSDLVDQVFLHVTTKKPAFVFLERPPDTIYHQSRCHPAALVARAQSVFKVIGVTYSLYSRLRQLVGISIFPVDPVKWQERSSIKRGGLEIKDWSLKMANGIIATSSDSIPNLHTDRDENIADAISMGYISYSHGLAN
jgi:hypothetical protein